MFNFFVQRFLSRLILSTLLVSWVTAAVVPHFSGGPRSLQPESGGYFSEPSAGPAQWENDARYHAFVPLVISLQPRVIELQDAWVSNDQGVEGTAYLVGDEIQYWISGTSTFAVAQQVNLEWSLSGPCGPAQVFSGMVTLEPGEWQHVHPSTAPGCSGEHTATVELYGDLVPLQTLSTRFTVDQTTTVVVSDQQGFDRCALSQVSEMAEWWQNSPYQVYNLYLGGVSFYCKDNPLDAAWVEQVAGQGWRFIQTWVGPQAPCTDKYSNRFSYDPETAYSQGRQEAQSAAEASRQLGFTGENIIYYDLEGYHDDVSSCHNAVAAFLEGWTEKLHELGVKSGVYGGACSSFVSRWAEISPPPDDVWIAHWYRSEYDPGASVWDASCVPNDLWDDHQRIKQYAGDHLETWGEVSLGIDSNVLDGEVVAFAGKVQESGAGGDLQLQISGTEIQDLGMLGVDRAWVLSGGNLLLTQDGGDTWVDHTPAGSRVLDVDFYSQLDAWLVRQINSTGELGVMRTQDGGRTWDAGQILPEADRGYRYASAFVAALDGQTAWVVLKIPSGGSFSLGRLLVTEDGGATWQEREAPLGEPVRLLDARSAWMAGGPAGDQLYRTMDGGRTWQPVVLDLPSGGYTVVGLPGFSDRLNGWLAAWQRSDGHPGGVLLLYRTRDGGAGWKIEHSYRVEAAFSSSRGLLAALPFLAGRDPSALQDLLTTRALPPGISVVDFYAGSHGLAFTRTGTCQRAERSPAGAPSHCTRQYRLLSTGDGGFSWRDVGFNLP